MRRAHIRPWPLTAGILGISVLAWFMNNYTPTFWYFIALFFLLIFISSFLLVSSVINNVRRSILIATGFCVWLALRALNLREITYLILLIATLVSFEIVLEKK